MSLTNIQDSTNMNSAELRQLEWCYSCLTDEQIADCEAEAMEVAGAELHQQEAAELLVRLYARMILRNVKLAPR